MRRAIVAVALSGLVLTAGACDSDADSTVTGPILVSPSSAPATSPSPDYSADTKLVCDKVATIFREDMNGFSTQIGKMIARKEADETADAEKAEEAAAAQLKIIGTKIKKVTAAAQDPGLAMAGASSAAKLIKSSTDARFFDGIDTSKDLESKIEGKLTDWMDPVTGYCAR